MSLTILIRGFILVSALLATTAAAAPPGDIAPVTVTPSWLPPDTPTSVTITATIAHPHVVPRSVILQERLEEQWEGVGHLTQDPSAPTQFSLTLTRTEPAGTAVQFRVSAAFRGQLRRGLSELLTVYVATRAEPQEETTILDPLNPDIQLILPEDSLTTPVYAAVTTQEPEALTVDLGGRTPDLVLNITLQPEGISPDTVLTRPYQLNVPAPADAPEGTRFNVAVPILADAPEGGGLREQLLAVDTAIVENGYLLTRATELEGLFYDGPVLFLRELGSGIAEGQVSFRIHGGDTSPGNMIYIRALPVHLDGTPIRDYIWNPYVFLTDDKGKFRIPIDPTVAGEGAPTHFKVRAIAPVHCFSGHSEVFPIPSNGGLQRNVDIGLDFEIANPLLTATRDGFRNGGFEEDFLVPTANFEESLCTRTPGSVPLLSRGPKDQSIPAYEGKQLAIISAGAGVVQFEQPITVPRMPTGPIPLRFQYRFPCMTCPHPQKTFLQNDAIRVQVLVNGTVQSNRTFTRNLLASPYGNWEEGKIDLAGLSGEHISVRFEYLGGSDNPIEADRREFLYLDNIRFGTVFIDVKILDGAMADLPDDATRVARVLQQVRDANAILFQAGINVRVRRVVTPHQWFNEHGVPIVRLNHPCPGTLSTANLLDIAYASSVEPGDVLPTPNNQLQDLLGRCRSSVSTDINVYYVNILRHSSGSNSHSKYGLAIGADDYHLDGTPGPGLIIRNMQNLDTTEVLKADRQREVLAHELGHLLIGGIRAGQTLEHDTLGGNLMTERRCSRPNETNVNPVPCSSRAIMMPEQSEQIHATNGGGFLVD